MSQSSGKLDILADGYVGFNCPGCGEIHIIAVAPAANGTPRPVWGYNGNPAAPTFTPSILARSGHHMDGGMKECWCTYEARFKRQSPFKCGVCHSFVTDGQIQFLGDCTHALAGQTVPLPDWSEP